MLKKILVELLLRAYKMGRADQEKKCEADYREFEKMVDELLI